MVNSESLIVGIRHGQSTGNIQHGRYQGRSINLALTEIGKRQAALVGPWLKNVYGTPDAVYASPAVRTRATASIALEAAGLDLSSMHDARLLELDRGDWEGELYHEKETPAVKRRMETEGLYYSTPGGESMRDVQLRMEEVLLDLPEGNVWLFGHGLALRCAIGDINGWNHRQIIESGRHMYNTSVTEFNQADTALSLGRYALTEHLPADLLTT